MINQALKLIRKYHNETQTETASKLGISKSHLSEIESGKKKPSYDLLEKYAEMFNMPLSSILFFAEKQSEPESVKKAHSAIAGKAIKMLDWLETIT